MQAVVIAIGDELLAGKTVNNNAAYLSARLSELGIGVRRQLVVGDCEDDIVAALAEARALAPFAIATGGLGPTNDDLTLGAVSRWLKRELILHPQTLKYIEERFSRRGIPMPAVNVGQARVPAGARVLRNALGTAPGIVIEEEGWTLALLPGVPVEMEYIFAHGVTPYLEEKGYGGERVFEWTLQCVGLPESAIAERIGAFPIPSDLHLAYLPHAGQVNLRFWGGAATEGAFRERAQGLVKAVRDALGLHVFGEGGASLEEVVGGLLRDRNATLAVAESCTAGLLAGRITNVAGSSAWFRGGVVAYANDLKTALLGVAAETLAAYGAVSEETARELAAGARERLGADYGLAVTGIAGPAGGTAEKPVGTVCFGVAFEEGVGSEKAVFNGDRAFVRHRAVLHALDFLRRRLLGKGRKK